MSEEKWWQTEESKKIKDTISNEDAPEMFRVSRYYKNTFYKGEFLGRSDVVTVEISTFGTQLPEKFFKDLNKLITKHTGRINYEDA